MYGFNKVKNTSGHHEFKHKHFRRGQRKDLALIKRKMNNLEGDNSEPSAELKNLQLEYQRVKQASTEFEDSLKVLVKQNKKLMEANRQLVYQFYYFKKESDLKAQKILFLFYSLVMQSSSEVQEFFRKAFRDNLYPKDCSEPIQQTNAHPIFYEGLEQHKPQEDVQIPNGGQPKLETHIKPALLWQQMSQPPQPEHKQAPGMMEQMMKNMFKGTGPDTQFVDEMITELLAFDHPNSNKNQKDAQNFNMRHEAQKNASMDMTDRSKPHRSQSRFDMSNQTRSNHFQRPPPHNTSNRPRSFQSKQHSRHFSDLQKNYPNHSENLGFIRDKGTKEPIRFSKNGNDFEKVSRTPKSKNKQNDLLESIENKLIKFNFNPKKEK